MTNFGLTQEQAIKLLLSDRLGSYIAEYLQLKNPEVFYEDRQLSFRELDKKQKVDAALYAFAQGAETIEKIEDPKSSEYEIQIAECEGIYGVWSESTDWVIPFNSYQDAKDFVDQNLK